MSRVGGGEIADTNIISDDVKQLTSKDVSLTGQKKVILGCFKASTFRLKIHFGDSS